MDLQHAKILLEKINALYKSISADESRVSSIERDLILSYIRQLYDSFLEVEEIEPPKPKKKKEKKKIKALDLEIIEPEEKKEEKPKIKKARIIEIPDSLKDLEEASISKKAPTPPPAPAPPPEPEPIPEPVVEKTPPPAPTPSLDPSIEELFEHKTATELSEKLSERPVTDLTKSMSINDRLLYMNTLFGKSMDALNIALTHLNTLDGMSDAKPYLIKLAAQHDWMDKGKQETAKDFIKLIRRRYQ
jgi:hypothetical protein